MLYQNIRITINNPKLKTLIVKLTILNNLHKLISRHACMLIFHIFTIHLHSDTILARLAFQYKNTLINFP